MSVSPQLNKSVDWSQRPPSRGRSNPIVIASCETSLSNLRLSDDDEEEDDNDGERDRQQNVKSSTSTSTSRPPGAPRLSSQKEAEERLAPPIMTLTENDEYRPQPMEHSNTYGSLRESHLEGKFMDGPASYRDRTSGEIKFLQHRSARLKLNDRATSYQNNSLSTSSSFPSKPFTTSSATAAPHSITQMTLGDRLRASPVVNAPNQGSKKSGLSSMLEGIEPLPSAKTTSQTPTLADSDFQQFDGDSHMLSTSLTGLEFLQAARRNHSLLAKPSSYPAVLPPPLQLNQPPMQIPGSETMDDNNIPFEFDLE